jgi:hypothetical protein
MDLMAVYACVGRLPLRPRRRRLRPVDPAPASPLEACMLAAGCALGLPSAGPLVRLESLRACGSVTTPGRAVCVLES